MDSVVNTYGIGTIPFSVLPFDDAVAEIVRRSHARESTAVHFANAYTIALADVSVEYSQLFSEPNALNLTDGVPVAWVGRRAYSRSAQQWPRVYGPDVMRAVLTADTGLGHYLLGGSDQTLAQLRRVIAGQLPQASIVGAESPPFRDLTSAERAGQDQRIRDSGAHVVWVGLGTPKQDWEVARLAGELPVVALAVGAAFDFLAGTKSQAPLLMQRTGTEWLHRLVSEPRRLGRRYLWGNPRFLRAALRNPGFRKG